MFKFCPNCGTKNQGWKICPECGTPLEQPAEPQNDTASRIEDLSALARTAVLEKQRELAKEQEEAALAQTKKQLVPFEYDEHADGTYTVTKLKDRSAPIITVPGRVVSIGDGAFEGCDRLRKVYLPEGLLDIGAKAFYGCTRLVEIAMPKSLLAIEASAFRGCPSLTEVLFPQDANPTIEEDAFDEDCVCGHSREEIEQTRADRKRRKEEEAARKAEEERRAKEETARRAEEERRSHYHIENGVLTKYDGEEENVVIPAGVKAIGEKAFEDCSALTQITIPNGVTEIGEEAFYGCKNLTQITIPNSVTKIGNSAFEECSSLTQITIPNSVTKIGNSAFEDCENLRQITLPNSLIRIGANAFDGCSSLTQITIPNSVKLIGWWAFSSCDSLTIYCEAASKPNDWFNYWNPDNRPVIWGCKK